MLRETRGGVGGVGSWRASKRVPPSEIARDRGEKVEIRSSGRAEKGRGGTVRPAEKRADCSENLASPLRGFSLFWQLMARGPQANGMRCQAPQFVPTAESAGLASRFVIRATPQEGRKPLRFPGSTPLARRPHPVETAALDRFPRNWRFIVVSVAGGNLRAMGNGRALA